MNINEKLLIKLYLEKKGNKMYMEKFYTEAIKLEVVNEFIEIIGELIEMGYMKKLFPNSYFHIGDEYDLVPEGIVITTYGKSYAKELLDKIS